jgi:hypothetical protein
MKFAEFLLFFCPPGSGSTDPIESGSTPDPDPKYGYAGYGNNTILHVGTYPNKTYHVATAGSRKPVQSASDPRHGNHIQILAT